MTGIGGLYFNTDITIAGFQSRVGCLFFLVSQFGDAVSACGYSLGVGYSGLRPVTVV